MLVEPDQLDRASVSADVTSPPLDPARSRVLLVGTTLAVQQLELMLGLLDPQPEIVGSLLAPPSALRPSRDALTLSVLGSSDQLTQVLAEHDVDLVLVSMPVTLASQTRKIAEALDASGVAWRVMPTLADQLSGRLHHTLKAAQVHGGIPEKNIRVGSSRASLASDSRERSGVRSAGTFGRTFRGSSGSDNGGEASRISGTSRGSEGTSGGSGGPGMAPWMIDPLQLLDRRPKPLDERGISRVIAGKVVLITGAGGSIGSELARVIARFQPSKIVLVDRSENALFEIDRRLGGVAEQVPRASIVHDVTDVHRTIAMVTLQRPDVILHTAAHNHVPMMEDHPSEAVEGNFYGTRAIVDAAARLGVERFVMISTDKAANPTSVVGATKRLAELYIQYLDSQQDSVPRHCIFSMVRVGDVLGSTSGVLPLWTRQLACGEPLSVAHTNLERHFMTISEAAGLVLQSAALASGGEVFLLDMGEPIRVLELAKRFIRSHGLEPNVDVKIQITGVRSGEKLFEDRPYDSEDMLSTPHESIRTWRTPPLDPQRMRQLITTFDRLRGQGSDHWERAGRDSILAALQDGIPEMARGATSSTSSPAASR